GRDYVMKISEDVLDSLLETHAGEKLDPMDWDLPGLRTQFLSYFNINAGDLRLEELGIDELRETLWNAVQQRYSEREARFDAEIIRGFERAIMLHSVDVAWKDHLLALDHLKEGIGLRGYGQRDPLNEYKRESFEMFEAMRERVENEIITRLFRFEPVTEEQMLEQRRRREAPAPSPSRLTLSAPAKSAGAPPGAAAARKEVKVGRNDPCPCGSGKKYKKCHGAAAVPVGT
ncbi:MAG TPA: SEC-C metal-binding domain-containing protein, partial [Thermoanaerobaculia bacterium]|nr:SEC-C metal-binding domain-containing protein [Thermoanaerobaculia bacterium]